MFNSRGWLSVRPWAALLALGLFGSSTAFAQRDDYKVAPGRETTYDIPADAKPAVAAKTKADIRNRRNSVREGLREGDFNREAFDKWYLGYEFPTLTLYTPEALKDLYEGRKRLIKEDLERATNNAARTHLVDIAFKFFKDVASEDYHPAVRYNAMLIVGELNAKEPNRDGSNQTASVPEPSALGFMIKEFKNPDQIDAVRLAALLGINRHVQIDTQVARGAVPQAELQEIRTLALDLVKTQQAPAGRTQDGHDWMRRRGLEILSWLAAGKPDQEIVDEIVARLSDSDENRGLRAEAAAALSIVKFQLGSTAVTIKPKEVAANLLQFVVDGVTADVDRVDKYVKSMEEANEIYTSSGGGGFSGGRMTGGMSGMGRGSMGPAPGGSSRPGGSSMGPTPGKGMSGGSSMGPTPGKGMSGGSSMGPTPGKGMSGGSSMGPTPGKGMSGGSSKGMSSMMPRGSGAGGYGSFGAQGDPYAYRLEPIYRKLRYEISCAMRGLRGTPELRAADSTSGLYGAKPTPEEKEYLARAAVALRDLAARFKVKSDELDTTKFTLEASSKLAKDLEKLTALTNEVVVKAKPKAEGPELNDPLSEPDPADDLLEAEQPPAKTTAADAAGKAKK